jgi:hypothetical protein
MPSVRPQKATLSPRLALSAGGDMSTRRNFLTIRFCGKSFGPVRLRSEPEKRPVFDHK